MSDDLEAFGTPSQQMLERRCWTLWQDLKDDPDIACHGRGLGLSHDVPESLTRQIALARNCGASACEGVPDSQREAHVAALEAAGLATDRYANWMSGQQTPELAERRLAARPLPDDLRMIEVRPDTPAEVLAAADQLGQTCEMLLPMGPFLRGIARPATAFVALEDSGRAVGMAATVSIHHPASPHHGLCWWGLLAAHPDRRGEGIASRLGAETLLGMRRRHGLTRFFTGIRQGNTPSEALCSRLGFSDHGDHVIIAIDSAAFGGTRVTK